MRTTSRFYVERGRYCIGYSSHGEHFFPSLSGHGTKLLYAHPGGSEELLMVLPGLFDGPLGLTVETGDSVTPQDSADWEITEDAVVTGCGEDLCFYSLFCGRDGDLISVPLAAGQRYRLRLHARGVTEAIEGPETGLGRVVLGEHHLIQIVAS